MEFAAGMSHELRTPLAVIRSAAHNLRSGIVRDKEGIEQYASIVQEEARRLSDMVEEVLLYSETQSGRKKYDLEPIDLNEAIDRAVTNPWISLGRKLKLRGISGKRSFAAASALLRTSGNARYMPTSSS